MLRNLDITESNELTDARQNDDCPAVAIDREEESKGKS
jgi:hypothetical protein